MMTNTILKPKRLRSKKILDSARGEPCQIRIPGVCNRNLETTVACHLNGSGIGTKHSDIFVAYGCSACHDEIDRRTRRIPIKDARCFLIEGVIETQQILIDKELIWA